MAAAIGGSFLSLLTSKRPLAPPAVPALNLAAVHEQQERQQEEAAAQQHAFDDASAHDSQAQEDAAATGAATVSGMAAWGSNVGMGPRAKSGLGALGTRMRSLSRRSLRRQFFAQASEMRTDTDVASLDELFYSAYACRHFTRSARMQLCRIAQLQQFDAGDILCLPGQPMDCVFFIIGGQVEFSTTSPGSQSTDTTVLETGASLGTFLPPASADGQQAAAQQQQHRQQQQQASSVTAAAAATLELTTPRTRRRLEQPLPRVWGGYGTAATDCEVAMVTQAQWLQLCEEDPHWDARSVTHFFEDLPVFGSLSKAQLYELARLVKVKQVPAGALVYRQGAEGDEVYVLRRGYVRLLRELHLNGQARESMNLLTHAITGLQYQIDVLKTPRSAAVLPQAPQLIPGTARAPDALLGSKHASGALTHRPRLERASPDAQQQSPYLDSRPSLESRPSGAVSSRSLYSPMRISVRSPHDDGTPRSPGAGGYSFHKHESRGWSREGPRSPGPPHLSHPKPSILHGDEPRTPGRPMHITIPVSDDSPSPGGAATASSPRKVHHGSTSESTTPHGDRGDKAHLREVSRLSARVVQRAMSTRRPPQRQVSSLRQPEPLTPGPLELSPSARAAEGATDRLMETLRSKKRAELKLLMPDAAAAAADQAASPSQPGSPAKGTRPAGGGASGAGARGGGASLAATVTVQALGPGAHMPFTGASPRHLYPSSSAVFVEMDMLGSGRIFGEGNRGDKARQRLCSAVADTHVELLVLEKTEVESRLGDMVSFLWNQEPVEGKPLTTDRAFRAQLERTMRWEVYKKTMVQDVYTQKRARLELS